MMKMISRGYAGSYWDPPEPAIFEDDFGNEGQISDEYICFDDGYQLFVEGEEMNAINFIAEYNEHLNINVQRAKHNSLLDVAGVKVHKREKYWTFQDDIYSYKTLKAMDFRFFVNELADLCIGEFEYEEEEPDPDVIYENWKEQQERMLEEDE